MGSGSDQTPGGDPLRTVHTFSCGGRDYVVEGSSASVIEVDSEVGRVLAEIRAAPAAPQQPSVSAPPEARAGVEQLREKVRAYAEGGKRLRLHGEAEHPAEAVELGLCVSFRCNLACTYCFARLGARDRTNASGEMTLETAQAAVGFALDHLSNPTGRLVVSFGHIGEPLLSRRLYQQLVEHIRRRATETGRSIAFGSAATNFTLVKDGEIPDLAWPTISLDGPKDVHDRVRMTPSGEGTYDTVVAGIRRLLAERPEAARGANLVATITRYSTDIKRIFLHLASFGIPCVTLYPVRLPPTSELAITEAAADGLIAGYDDLVQHLLSLDDGSRGRVVQCLMHAQDYFGRHALRIALGHRVVRRCDAGSDAFAVMPDGGVFPCPELAALGSTRIGSIHEGMDEAALSELRSRDVRNASSCSACWARLWCGGECLSDRAMYEPFGTPPDPGMCRFTRGIIEKGIHFVSQLRARDPEALRACVEEGAFQVTGTTPAQDEPRDEWSG